MSSINDSAQKKKFVFGYFPRHKYQDLVFYVKTGEYSNLGLFEMPDTKENRELMEDLQSPDQSINEVLLMNLFRFQCGACGTFTTSCSMVNHCNTCGKDGHVSGSFRYADLREWLATDQGKDAAERALRFLRQEQERDHVAE